MYFNNTNVNVKDFCINWFSKNSIKEFLLSFNYFLTWLENHNKIQEQSLILPSSFREVGALPFPYSFKNLLCLILSSSSLLFLFFSIIASPLLACHITSEYLCGPSCWSFAIACCLFVACLFVGYLPFVNSNFLPLLLVTSLFPLFTYSWDLTLPCPSGDNLSSRCKC